MALLVLGLAVSCSPEDEAVGNVERPLTLECQYSYGANYEGSSGSSWSLRVSQDGSAELSTLDACGDPVREAAMLTPEEFQPLAAAYEAVQAAGCANRYITHGTEVAHFRIRATCNDSEQILETVGGAMPSELAALQEALIAVKRSIQ